MKNKQEITIRKVVSSEIKILRELSLSTFRESFSSQNTPSDMEIYLKKAFSIEQITKEFNHPDSSFYFVMEQDEITGYLKLNEGSAQTEKFGVPSIEIERIYVIGKYQGMKIGQKLIEEAISIAHSKAVDMLWLGVWEENKKAIKFYQRHGFIPFAKHNFMLGKDEQTDVLMKRQMNYDQVF